MEDSAARLEVISVFDFAHHFSDYDGWVWKTQFKLYIVAMIPNAPNQIDSDGSVILFDYPL